MKLLAHAGSSRKKSDSKGPPYYKGVHGVIVVFDVTDEDSFENASDVWLKDVKKFTDKKSTQKVLSANKCDKNK
jgi:GTPase SAR1 family protein